MTIETLPPRRQQLSEFLRTRRAQVQPADVGLPSAGRRNTPGLRREEVAVLAGVSASWYTWLEQARDIRVSPSILDAIASALMLDEFDRVYLYNLAEMNPPAVRSTLSSNERNMLVTIAKAIESPAFIVDKNWLIVYANAAAEEILGISDRDGTFLEVFFLNHRYRELFVNWQEMAECFVGNLRVKVASYPDEPALEDLITTLADGDPTFAALWKQHATAHRKARQIVIRIPGTDPDGRVFDAAALDLSGCDDLQLISYLPRTA